MHAADVKVGLTQKSGFLRHQWSAGSMTMIEERRFNTTRSSRSTGEFKKHFSFVSFSHLIVQISKNIHAQL